MRVIQSAILVVAGLAGLLVVAAMCAPLAGYALVRLETGSMSPNYPAGSILLVRHVPGSEVQVGDIVTVQRAGHAPVTHRVVDAVPAGNGTRLVLRGDANVTNDPEPYLVDRVGLHVAGLPVGGGLVSFLSTPAGIIGASVAASLLVLWAWWPAPGTSESQPARPYRRSAPVFTSNRRREQT